MQVLILMQGVPGSGKSTIANAITQNLNTIICSTDDFFYLDGEYLFDPSNLIYYHGWNQWLVRYYLAEGKSVIVDNTNILKDFARPYVQMAMEYGVQVQIVKVSANFENVHGVPKEIVERMKQSLQNLDELL